MSDAVVALNGHTMMDDALLAKAPRLKSIVFLGTGATSYIDVPAAERRGIQVRVVRGYGDRTVAEHAFGLLLAAARDTARMDRDLRAGCWAPRQGLELKGRQLGVVGLGGVGREMARIASSFGMQVAASSRSGVPGDIPAVAMQLDELLASSDAVSLHLALVPETKGVLGKRELARMKPGAILVNTARGALVDEAALLDALRSGHIGHAALDVYATEPLPAGHPLAALDNVTLASHAGWKSEAASWRLIELAFEIAETDARRIGAGEALLPQ
jgi:D-3-phosphoglycerate dehydrogenase